MIKRRVPSFSKAIAITGIVACLIILMRFFHITDGLSTMIGVIISPVQSNVYKLTHTSSTAEQELQKLSKSDLIAEYNDLQAQYSNLNATLAELRAQIEEQKLSSTQLSYLESRSFQGISAQVTGRSSSDAISTITINRGAQHGIVAGQAVIVENGSLIGTVHTTKDRSSLVRLITSPESKISITIQNEKKSPGILSGDFNLALYVDYIPQFDFVESNQIVATSGQDPLIPSGLPIGTVKEVGATGASLFQRAIIVPLVDAEKIGIVTVITQ